MEPLPGQLGFALADQQGDEHQVGRPVATSWWGFSLDHDEQAAVATFARRYGREPAELRNAGSCLLVGPLPVVGV